MNFNYQTSNITPRLSTDHDINSKPINDSRSTIVETSSSTKFGNRRVTLYGSTSDLARAGAMHFMMINGTSNNTRSSNNLHTSKVSEQPQNIR